MQMNLLKKQSMLPQALMLLMLSQPAFAGQGQPSPWQLGLQEMVTPVGQSINNFHNLLLVVITLITLFVLGLLVYVVVRFNEKANPVPSKTTHHVGLEVAWTLIPILILVVIAIPSFRLLREDMSIPKADVTLKVTGKEWYWSFEYPQDQAQVQSGFGFDSIMLDETQRNALIEGGKSTASESPKLLAVDNEALVPIGKVVRVQVTAADVIHKFSMPSFGIKIDAIPGRLNETWFKAEREGIYYGQCSFICGQNHAYMPIAIRVVSEAKYAEWLQTAKTRFVSLEKSSVAELKLDEKNQASR